MLFFIIMMFLWIFIIIPRLSESLGSSIRQQRNEFGFDNRQYYNMPTWCAWRIRDYYLKRSEKELSIKGIAEIIENFEGDFPRITSEIKEYAARELASAETA